MDKGFTFVILISFLTSTVIGLKQCSDFFEYNIKDRSALFLYEGSTQDVSVKIDLYLSSKSNAEHVTERFGLGEDLKSAAIRFKESSQLIYKVKFTSNGPIPTIKRLVINKNGICETLCDTSEDDTPDATQYYVGYTFYPKGKQASLTVPKTNCREEEKRYTEKSVELEELTALIAN